MSSSPEPAGNRVDRREFFRSIGRGAAIAALAAAAAWLASKTRSGTPANQSCSNRGVCGSCGQLASCGLPRALSAKHASGEG